MNISVSPAAGLSAQSTEELLAIRRGKVRDRRLKTGSLIAGEILTAARVIDHRAAIGMTTDLSVA